MRDIVHTYVRKFRKERRERRKFLGVLLVLALAVAGGIMWQFKTTGIALTNETQCGMEEHTHADECYAWVLTEDVSSEETAVEAETEEEVSGVLSAVVVEEAAVVESEAAETQDAAEDETSPAAENSGSEDAEAVETAVESGNAAEESAEAAKAEISEEALPAQVLLTEATETEDWYLSNGYEKVLICEKEEHTHTVECLNDDTADLETAEVWEATLPTLSGVRANDVAAIAKSQVGYTESTANFTLAEDGETRRGYTRYGAWYGNAYGDWDAMFAAFCLHYAGISESDFPVNSGAYAWSVSLKEAGLYATADSYTPAAGDLVFLDKDQDGTVDAVAVITGVNNTTLTVVEGNSNDAVEENTYEISGGEVAGYGVLPEQDAETLASAEKTYTASTEDGSVSVSVTAPYGALPEGAELQVTLFEESSDEYAAAAAAIGYEPETAEVSTSEDGIALASEDDTETETVATSGLAVLDICFMVNGVEVEPNEAVTVSIDASAIIPEEADATSIEVQHLTENENGEVEPVLVADVTEETAGTVTVDTEEATAVAKFEVDGFSTFTITWYSTTGNFGSTQTSTVYVYDTKGNDIEATASNFTFSSKYSSDETITFETLKENVSVPDGYIYSYATVVYTTTSGNGQDQTTTSTTIKDAYAIKYSTNTENGRTTYTLTVYTSSDDEDGTPITLGNNTTVTIYLYYENTNPQVEISASSSAVDGPYTLSASTSYFDEGENITLTWSFSATDGSNALTVTQNEDGSYTVSSGSDEIATITANNDGTYTVTWESAEKGYTITATVNATDGTNTAANTYTLTYSGASTNASGTTTFDHVDVKVTLAESENSTTSYILYSVSSVTVTENEETTTDTSESTYTDVNSEWQFFHSNNNGGGPGDRGDQDDDESVSVSYTYDATITIVYTLYNEDTNGYEEYTAVLTKDSTYAAGTYYPADGENAYKLYNYLYGTNYKDEDEWKSSSNYGDIDISGMSIFLVASILCDGSTVSYNSVSGNGGVGLDFALDVATLLQNTANFNMDVEKVFEGSDTIDKDQFTFNLYDVTDSVEVDDSNSTWTFTLSDATASESTSGATGSDGTTTETVKFDQITYSSVLDSDSDDTSATKTYYYIITETDSGEDCVTYDDTIYGVAVTVTTTKTSTGSGSSYIYTTEVKSITYYKLDETETSSTYTATVVTVDAEGSGVSTSGSEIVFTFTNTYEEQTTSIILKKVDSENSTTPLSGAVFTLGGGSTYTTETDGTVTISNITYGTAYTLTETAAPDGYNLLTAPIVFTVNSNGTVTFNSGNDNEVASYTYASGVITIIVKNTAGAVLPSTGGPGTYLYTLAGLLLIFGAVCLMYKNLRRKGDLPY